MLFSELARGSVFYISWRAIKAWSAFSKQRRLVGPVIYSDAFKNTLAGMLETRRVKVDRAGRLYCVVNPLLNANGVFDAVMIVWEETETGEGFSAATYSEQWLTRKLRVMQDLFRARGLFSTLEFSITPVGERGKGNHLVVIQPKTFTEWDYWKGRLAHRLVKYAVVAGIALCALKFCF